MLSPNGLTHYFSFQMELYTLVILSLSTVVWRTENGVFYILSLQTFSWVSFYSFNRFWLTLTSGAAAPGWTGPSAAHALWCRTGSEDFKMVPRSVALSASQSQITNLASSSVSVAGESSQQVSASATDALRLVSVSPSHILQGLS